MNADSAMKADGAGKALNAHGGGKSRCEFAVADNGKAKTSARGNIAIYAALFAPGLSHALDRTILRLPYGFNRRGRGLGQRLLLGAMTNGSRRFGADHLSYCPTNLESR
jgi:hypothetical protein